MNGKPIEKTPLFIEVEKGNIEIIQLLLSNSNIDVNILSIKNPLDFIKLFSGCFYCIQSIVYFNSIFKLKVFNKIQ